MDPTLDATGRELWHRVAALIERGIDAPADLASRDALAVELFAWQRQHSSAIDRVARAFAGDGPVTSVRDIPGIPTDAFKSASIACFDTLHAQRIFRTSGTTREVRGEHALLDTSLYTAGACAAARRFLLRRPPYRFVLLAERETDAPSSSLSFMLARFAERWSIDPHEDPWMIDHGQLDLDRVRRSLLAAARDGTPVALLGATFAFVHLGDALSKRLPLPHGSVVMPTGGFKGRSRELPFDELLDLLATRFGADRTDIVQEYGMTELSSQAYEAHADGVAPGRYVAPPWLRVDVVDPATLAPLEHGRTGLIRLMDLANVASCMAVQTSDLGVLHADGFEVLGRAPGATPRGCARALDALLAPRG